MKDAIPKMIQESTFGKACAQNFDQAQPVQKCPPIRNRGHFCRSKVWDAGAAKSRFLNHFRYKELLGECYLPHLEFTEKRIEDKVRNLCDRALDKGYIETRQKWLGAFYSKEIESSLIPELTIKWIDDSLGYGVFANCNIPKLAYVGEYTGELKWRPRWWQIHRLNRRNAYCFHYPIGEGRSSPFVIDAEEKGNHTRFINHSDEPNLEPVSVFQGGVFHIIFLASRPIQKGTQLCYDYGADYWTKRRGEKQLLRGIDFLEDHGGEGG
jgi:hypothetical protein